jgi:D-amino-acid dehydrogenase
VTTKIIILGGGITGLLTGYFLNKRGFEVTIVEKRSGVGLGASLANGSQISFSHITPSFFEKRQGIFGTLFSKETIESRVNKKDEGVKKFLLKQKDEILNEEKHIASLSKISEISLYCLLKIMKDEDIERRFKSSGIIHFFENNKSLEEARSKASTFNQKFRVLNKFEAIEIEPNIAYLQNKIAGGIYFENDKTSNCHDLCKIFEAMLRERGVHFLLNTNVKKLIASNSEIISAITEDNITLKADFFVCANGTDIPNITKTVDLDFDIFPVRGYSYTFNVENSNYAPFIGLIDRTNRMVYSLYKSYLRVAGFFDLGINSPVEISERMKDFENTIFESFPLLKRNAVVHKWTENRPFTPSSVPIIGKTTEFPNLLINGGHSSLGLTLSFGAGNIISELL